MSGMNLFIKITRGLVLFCIISLLCPEACYAEICPFKMQPHLPDKLSISSLSFSGRKCCSLTVSNPVNLLHLHTCFDSMLVFSQFSEMRFNDIYKNKHIEISDLTKTMPTQRYRPFRLAVTGGTLLTGNFVIYYAFRDAWWERTKSKFHFYRGWRRTSGFWDLGPHDSLWFHLDKLGHAYNARILSQCFYDLGNWAGLSRSTSYWTGACLSSLLMLEIELYDSQFEDWGFSIGDFIANEIGAFLPLLTYKYPVAREFSFKLSYHPSSEISSENFFVEDYAGMTFWLSGSPYRLIPVTLRKFWPQFLNFALGYSISKKAHGQVELYLAFDYNLTKLVPNDGLVKTILKKLDYIHLPAPAIKLTPNGCSYLLYF